MTLIAAMQMRGQPVLIGDLLISSAHPDATQIELPTLGALPADFRPDKTHIFSNLAQKLTLMNDRLIVAWSGTVVHARDFIKELRAAQNQISSAEDLRGFVESVGAGLAPHCQIICALKEGSNLRISTIGLTPLDTEMFGQCYFGGSGAGQFIAQLYAERHQTEEMSSDWQSQIGHALSLLGDAMGDELSGAPNFNVLYGGGYEIATSVSGTITKIGDILYLFWELEFTDEGQPVLSWLPVLYKVDYVRDVLLIRRVERQGGELKGVFNYAVAPIDFDLADGAFVLSDIPDLNSQFLVNHIRVIQEGKHTGSQITVHISPRGKGPFKVKEKSNRMGFQLERKFFLKCINDALGDHAGETIELRL